MKPSDPRIAALYDIDNPDGEDHDYFRGLTDRLDAQSVVDLGCGTGILTVTLARGSRTLVGIDPDDGMLDVARQRDGTERVTWVLGDSRDIGDARADLVLMTGNVVQHIGPGDWHRTLDDTRAGLRPGGMASFETRNPAVEAWRGVRRSRRRSGRTRVARHHSSGRFPDALAGRHHPVLVVEAASDLE